MTCRDDDNKRKVFHCDTCPEHIETGKEDFTQALIYMKRFGWKTYTGPDNDYAHACPPCVANYVTDQQAKAACK